MEKNNLDLKKIEENLKNRKELLQLTSNWWGELAQLKISELSYLQEKLQKNWSDELCARFENLQRDLKHLELKSSWEQTEIAKFEKQQNDFNKIREKTLLSILSKKLSEKLNHR